MNGLDILFNQYFYEDQPEEIKNKNHYLNYRKAESILELKVSSLSYYFSIHELFHFLIASKEQKEKINLGYTNSYIPSQIKKEEIIDEIQTVFLESAWLNDSFMIRNLGRNAGNIFGWKHQFVANNTVMLCSLSHFGKYKFPIYCGNQGYRPTPHPSSEKTTVENLARWLKLTNETEMLNKKITYTGEHQYRDICWDDYFLIAEASIEAYEKLMANNFIDSEFNVKMVDEWKISK